MWFDILKFISDNLHKIKYQKEENKKKIAKILLDISNLIYDVCNCLQSDVYPSYSCMMLAELSNNFVSELKGLIDEEKLLSFQQQLIAASNIESQYAARKEPNTINELMQISSRFKTFSILMG